MLRINNNQFMRCPCPQHSKLIADENDSGVRCAVEGCKYSNPQHGFHIVDNKPVLIRFEKSVCDEKSILNSAGSSLIARRSGLEKMLSRVVFGSPDTNSAAIEIFNLELQRACGQSSVLVIGVGQGSKLHRDLLDSQNSLVTAIDVFNAEFADVIADGHELPFADESFDAVIIQAVLEHVLSPEQVVKEIYRVLNPKGLVYAETPFMQQVHEGRYDYYRFTHLGHRWLFRNFEELTSGVLKGPGTSFLWSLRYLIASLIGSKRVAGLLVLPFFWLRFLDLIARKNQTYDSASEYYFLGVKSETELTPQELIQGYSGAQ